MKKAQPLTNVISHSRVRRSFVKELVHLSFVKSKEKYSKNPATAHTATVMPNTRTRF